MVPSPGVVMDLGSPRYLMLVMVAYFGVCMGCGVVVDVVMFDFEWEVLHRGKITIVRGQDSERGCRVCNGNGVVQ